MIGVGIRVGVSGARFTPSRLFSVGEQGAWFDPSDLSTMYQDSAGVDPVTAAGQPVGLILDKRRGLARGAEKWDDAQVAFGSQCYRVSPGVYRVVSTDGTSQVVSCATGTPGATYEVTFTIDEITGTLATDFIGAPSWTTTGEKRFIASLAGSGLTFKRSGVMNAQISNISVKEIPGNRATQSTAASRPVLQQDTSGRYYLAFDGVDDWLSVPNSTGLFKFLHDSTGATVHIGAAMSGTAVFHSLVSTSNLGLATAIGWSFSQDDRAAGAAVNTVANGSGALFVNQTPASAVSSSLRTYTAQNGAGVHVIRRDGAVLSGSATETETGSPSLASSTYDLTIGRSGAGVNPFNGRLYSLIVRGALSSQSQIEQAERYVNSKTGAY